MERLKHTSANIASLGTTRQRISPYRKTGLYMELHKLDYERNHLQNKLKKMEIERNNIERRLSLLQNDMTALLGEVTAKSGVSLSEKETVETKRLKY